MPKCSLCIKDAEWHYAPSTKRRDLYFCDRCVPRGCSCNVVDLDDNNTNAEQFRDAENRLLPCVEYDFVGERT